MFEATFMPLLSLQSNITERMDWIITDVEDHVIKGLVISGLMTGILKPKRPELVCGAPIQTPGMRVYTATTC
jgi:hypothetical protein